MLLLSGDVDEDVNVGMGAVIHDMSRPTSSISMVIGQGHST